jgi:hypothetical protein
VKYRDISSTVLRATLGTFKNLGVLSKQCAAIEHELMIRAWADAVEIHMHRLIRWCRGGLS